MALKGKNKGENMNQLIKHKNDFVLAAFSMVLSVFLLFGKITASTVPTGQGGLLARSDVWLRMIAGIMLLTSLMLLLRSLFKVKDLPKDSGTFHFYLDGTIIAIIAILVTYTIALPLLGFMISTFLAQALLTILFTVRERGYTWKALPREEMRKIIIRSLVISAILLLIYYLVFGVALSLQLPKFDLFYRLGIGA